MALDSTYSFITATDTTRMQAGDRSMFDAIGDAFTKGAPSAVLSGAYSLYNTGVDISNKVFGTTAARADTLQTLESIDSNWASYYKENKEVIDVAGFVAGSLVPGTLAIKGLKMAQAGVLGGAFRNTLGYTATKETFYLNKAVQELATEGGTVFTRINSAKLSAMAWGTADSVLQMAAFETATAITMKASPILDKEDWHDIAWDGVKNTLLGGAIGGGITSLLTNKLIKDSGKLVANQQRLYDVLADAGKVDLRYGDRAFQVIDSVLALPKEVLEGTINFAKLDARLVPSSGVGNVAQLMQGTVDKSIQQGVLKLETALVGVTTDKSIARPFASALIGIAKEGIATNVDPMMLRARMSDYLLNLHSVEGLAGKPTSMSGDLRFLNPLAQVTDPTNFGLMEARTQSRGMARYRVIGDENAAKTATLGKEVASEEEAIARNFDFIFDPASKRMTVSPQSTIYRKAGQDEELFSSSFLNLTSMQTSGTTVPTIADVQTARTLSRNQAGVQSGDHSYAFTLKAGDAFKAPADSLEATARHYWADDLRTIGGLVDSRDISIMDALRAHPERAAPDLKILDFATGRITTFENITDLNSRVFTAKFEGTIKLLEEAGTKADARDIAYRMNVSQEWIDNFVSVSADSKSAFAHPGWQQDLARYGSRDNIILRFDTKAMQDASAQFPEAYAAWGQRIKEASSKAADGSKIVLGESYNLLPEIRRSLAQDADGQTVGASFVQASNAGYGDRLRATVQYIGSIFTQVANTRNTAALSKLQPAAAAVLGSPIAAAEISAAVTKARLSTEALSLFRDLDGSYRIVDLESYSKYLNGAPAAFKQQTAISKEAGDFLKAHQELHASRVDQHTVLNAAVGSPTRFNANQLYMPPVDTSRIPFFAFVRQQEGTIFGSSEVAMLTARDAGELQAKIAQVEKQSGMRVITKGQTEDYFRAKADYDYSRAMNEPQIDSHLRKQGLLGDYFPNMTPQAVVEDFVNFTQRAETQLVRDAVGAKYAQSIAELQDLSNRYTQVQTSKFEGLTSRLIRSVQDPFGDAVKSMMNISKRGEFTLWHQANEFVDALGTTAYRGIEKSLLEARGGQITWEQANEKMRQFGLRPVFDSQDAFLATQTGPDRNILKTALQKANMILATTMLRLDLANSMLNVLSTPILLGTELSAIKQSLKNDPQLFAQLDGLTKVGVPGTQVQVPSATKAIFNAVAAWVKEPKEGPLLKRFQQIGAIKGEPSLYHEMVDDLSLTPNLVPGKYAEKVEKWVEVGAKLSLNEQAETFTRFVSAHVMHQMTDPLVQAGKMAEAEASAFISIFTNRVQGNYVSSQRPILFQGTLGSAVGLFQTYQFNMLQQLFRHIENRDVKTLAVMAGLQTSLYGLNGLPYFDAINTHIVGGASINEKHNDAYSYAVKAVGKEWGDWLMYGTASAFPLFSDKAPALYTRGDLNPRNTFITPTSPMEVPAVQASIKAVSALVNMGQQVGAGSGLTDALLFGLEHNGLSRPLAGLAQVLKGDSTTGKGNLISASSDWTSITSAARLIGAKPMDESIAVSNIYRNKAYEAMDRDRLEVLGQVVKNKLRAGEQVDWTEIQGAYAARGGRIDKFGAAIQRWDKDAKVSVANSFLQHANTSAGQRLITVMGGTPLTDYRNMENPE